jgi:hypothetical protein
MEIKEDKVTVTNRVYLIVSLIDDDIYVGHRLFPVLEYHLCSECDWDWENEMLK